MNEWHFRLDLRVMGSIGQCAEPSKETEAERQESVLSKANQPPFGGGQTKRLPLLRTLGTPEYVILHPCLLKAAPPSPLEMLISSLELV